VKELLTKDAYAVWPHIHERARIGLSQTDSWGGLVGTNQLNPKDNPSKKAFFDQLELTNPALRILAPIRISQAAKDTRINANATRTLHYQLSSLNGPSNVTYKEYEEVSTTEKPEELGASSSEPTSMRARSSRSSMSMSRCSPDRRTTSPLERPLGARPGERWRSSA
jgi:hypothetical protein